MQDTVVIDRRYCGPPNSGHGGYVSGMVAGYIDGPAEVTLRVPPPLDRPMTVTRLDDGSVALHDGETVVAEARPADIAWEAPPPPPYAEAEQARERYIGLTHEHHYPTCFVCGTGRQRPDGMRLFPGAVPSEVDGLIAAPWVPDETLADENGIVKPEFLWSALDCPGGIAAMGDDWMLMLLGRFAARVEPGVKVGDRLLALGWPGDVDGRKYYAGSALYTEGGRLVGVARATWILVDKLPS